MPHIQWWWPRCWEREHKSLSSGAQTPTGTDKEKRYSRAANRATCRCGSRQCAADLPITGYCYQPVRWVPLHSVGKRISFTACSGWKVVKPFTATKHSLQTVGDLSLTQTISESVDQGFACYKINFISNSLKRELLLNQPITFKVWFCIGAKEEAKNKKNKKRGGRGEEEEEESLLSKKRISVFIRSNLLCHLPLGFLGILIF